MIAAGKTIAEIAAVGSDWRARIAFLQPRLMLELGTGQGASGAVIMSVLPASSVFITINYPDGHRFGEFLDPWRSDHRCRQLDQDSTDPKVLDMVPDGVDLLFIDSTHEAWHAATELRLWQSKLEDGAVVVADDLNQHDMQAFWDSIPYEKHPITAGACQGVFRYDASHRYTATFARPKVTTYGPPREHDAE